jgi:CRP/FNR family cyclic AMP-dependent transcriptional regulator
VPVPAFLQVLAQPHWCAGAKYIRQTVDEELSFTTVRHRLASFLFRLAHKEGEKTTEGMKVELPANNQELASQIGTVRELVSRNLSRLQAEGILKIEGCILTICDLQGLEAELESSA